MPLQQIGTHIRVSDNELQRQSRPANAHSGSAGSDFADHEEYAGDHDGTYITNNDDVPSSLHAFARYEPQDMTLLKLGGVGGVQRSGSRSSGRRESVEQIVQHSNLHESPEMFDVSSPLDRHQHATRNAWHSAPLEKASAHRPTSSWTSDEPSSSGRSSTSSSSAAAFSLRSLSKRNSNGSTSSSAGSSMRRLTSHDGHGSEGADALTMARDTRSDDTYTSGDQQTSMSAAATSSSSLATQGTLKEQPHGSIGPSVQRIQSIGRGYDTRKPIGRHSDEIPFNEAQGDRLPADNIDDDDDSTQSPDATFAPVEDDTIVSLDLPRAFTSTSPQPDLMSKLDALTLIAAAKAPTSPENTTKFLPPEPRRHTGSFALRSRSALSRTLGDSLNFGNGQGRAAARKELANIRKTSSTALPAANDAAQVTNVHVDDVSAVSPTSDLQMPSRQSPVLSPRTRASRLSTRPSLLSLTSNQNVGNAVGDRNAQSPTEKAYSITKGRLSSSNDAFTANSSSPRLHAHLRSPATPTGSDGGNGGNANAFEPGYLGMPMQDVYSFLSTSPVPSATAESVGGSSGGIARPRPQMGRSNTALNAINVLRTPTTEEWSRYLIKQGLDPTLMTSMQGKGMEGVRGDRSRSNTTRSAIAAGKRRVSDRDAAKQPTSASASMSAFDPNDVMEALRRSTEVYSEGSDGTIRRPRQSNSSSVRVADDLHSVHEEDDDEDAAAEAVLRRQFLEGDDGDHLSGSDEESDGSDERMRALHEAISRPPSRKGSPVQSGSMLQEKQALGVSAEAIRTAVNPETRRGTRWPSRDTAAALMGYPLPPAGTQRNIHDFHIIDDIGRGAYGLVKRARVRDDTTGRPVGPEFCIKYIIKSRILADCWRRHKVLGPIPIEIHVLDQLRRLPYQYPETPPPWSAEKLLGISSDKKGGLEQGVTVGHPSLCMMVDFFEDHEFYYAVMPCFGAGQDLFDYIESQPHGLTTTQVRCVFGQLADGLRFLHGNNIVHRDVKDENVILDGRGHIQLIDFGSAAHIITRNGEQRLFDTFSGTLDYAAAEILRGEKYGGKEQDVWALGVVGYVLLCGDCPFWNGEEAMEGLHEGTRAFNVLIERCAPMSRADAEQMSTFFSDALSAETIRPTQLINSFSGEISAAPLTHEEDVHGQLARRKADIDGQADGGGCVADAADLILRCLEIDSALRPTMEEICRHRFLIGQRGWTGRLGWLQTRSPSASQ